MRPDAAKLLSLPILSSWLQQKHYPIEISDVNNELLNTIIIPTNLNLLTDKLPKPT